MATLSFAFLASYCFFQLTRTFSTYNYISNFLLLSRLTMTFPASYRFPQLTPTFPTYSYFSNLLLLF